jgi:hypothetical protein
MTTDLPECKLEECHKLVPDKNHHYCCPKHSREGNKRNVKLGNQKWRIKNKINNPRPTTRVCAHCNLTEIPMPNRYCESCRLLVKKATITAHNKLRITNT